MTLDNQRILDLFAMFTDMHDSELENWRGLCESAALDVARRIKKNVDARRHMERLCTAAAACAYCNHAILCSGGSALADEVKVGDISLKSSRQDDTRLDATSIRDFFLADISDLINYPTGVAFKSAECAL